MKQSRIRRLIAKKLARELTRAEGPAREELEAVAERESVKTVAKMTAKGFRLVTRLDSGEGVFVREDDLVGLHVQLPAPLYRRLEAAGRDRAATKRDLVIEALERFLTQG